MNYQDSVKSWSITCFGKEIAADKTERNYRFLEEALELVQSLGCGKEAAHQLVEYVYGRPIGEPKQEVGGVMTTLATLCNANDINMADAGWAELDLVWKRIDKIRQKQKAKPKFGPLPQ